ncbi:hypothetical protein M378DRAFT_159632 [Amanita muscaria Koide BX008]|uniref:Uncharacterized protein n=1 Tax=Amanita muscaria (strain Koide BX008) TaxID=946122 RepID=A0A0C2XEI0_AMAMK|nr:hypothetical protein M378DRAFT_159632 [Amanita muscaria Koide BX008]
MENQDLSCLSKYSSKDWMTLDILAGALWNWKQLTLQLYRRSKPQCSDTPHLCESVIVCDGLVCGGN